MKILLTDGSHATLHDRDCYAATTNKLVRPSFFGFRLSRAAPDANLEGNTCDSQSSGELSVERHCVWL